MKSLVFALLASLLLPAAQSQIIPTGSLMTIINGGSGAPTSALPTVPLGGVGNVRFADTSARTYRLRPDQTVSTFLEVVSDDNDRPAATVQFYLNLKRPGDLNPCKASIATLPTAVGLQKGKNRLIPVEITGCGGGGAEGYLGILGSLDPNKEVQITLERASSGWLTAALYLSLGLAIVIAYYSAEIVQQHGHKLTDAIGGASWDFSTSWASNLTAFGMGFSFLIQLTLFPDKPAFGNRSEYAFLAAFATALVGFAPAVQRMMVQTDIDASSGLPVATSHSSVIGFLIASVFTMWGAYLQISTAILIVSELGKTATLNMPITVAVGACVVLAGVGLMVYCWRTILTTIGANASRTGTATVKAENAKPMFAVTSPGLAAAAAGKISML